MSLAKRHRENSPRALRARRMRVANRTRAARMCKGIAPLCKQGGNACYG